MEDFLFEILNPVFNFIFWIIFDKERFLTAWSIFFTFNALFLIIYFLKFNDKESDR